MGSEQVQTPEQDDESEWEYEYHDTETEHLYITLDFTADPAAGSVPPGQRDPLGLRSRRSSRKQKSQPQERPTTPTHSVQASQSRQATPANADHSQDHVEELEQHGDDQTSSKPPRQIQILELHSANPLIAYNDGLYRCHWSQTLGTDMYFTKNGPHRSQPLPPAHGPVNGDGSGECRPPSRPHVPPLRQLKHHQLLGLGTAKLIAMPVSLRVKPMANAPPVPDDLKIQLPPDATEAKRKQAHFLEQLASIKRSKGETDTVPVVAQGTWARGRRARGGRARASRSISSVGRRRVNKPRVSLSASSAPGAWSSGMGVLVPSSGYHVASSTPSTFFAAPAASHLGPNGNGSDGMEDRAVSSVDHQMPALRNDRNVASSNVDLQLDAREAGDDGNGVT